MTDINIILSQAQKDAYIKKSGHCPICKSADIKGGQHAVSGDEAAQDVICNVCGASWVDIYKLSDVEIMQVGTVKEAHPVLPPRDEEMIERVSDLERYGVEWTGPQSPICRLMDDGYWTPWHVATDKINAVKGVLLEALQHMDDEQQSKYKVKLNKVLADEC